MTDVATGITWSDVIGSYYPSGRGKMYMVMSDDGVGSAETSSFNEYYLVALAGAYTDVVFNKNETGEAY